MRNPNEPMAIRRAMRPMLRALASSDVASLWTRHVNKAESKTFRQKAQGSMQFGAVARSSFLIAEHPKDPTCRVAVLGKANYVKDKVALSFAIAECVFEANGHLFSVGRVVDVEQESITMEEALGGGQTLRERKRDDLAQAVLKGVPSAKPLGDGTWHPPAKSGHAIAQELGRSKTDGSVRRILNELAEDGLIEKVEGGWIRKREDQEDHPTPNEPLFRPRRMTNERQAEAGYRVPAWVPGSPDRDAARWSTPEVPGRSDLVGQEAGTASADRHGSRSPVG